LWDDTTVTGKHVFRKEIHAIDYIVFKGNNGNKKIKK